MAHLVGQYCNHAGLLLAAPLACLPAPAGLRSGELPPSADQLAPLPTTWPIDQLAAPALQPTRLPAHCSAAPLFPRSSVHRLPSADLPISCTHCLLIRCPHLPISWPADQLTTPNLQPTHPPARQSADTPPADQLAAAGYQFIIIFLFLKIQEVTEYH